MLLPKPKFSEEATGTLEWRRLVFRGVETTSTKEWRRLVWSSGDGLYIVPFRVYNSIETRISSSTKCKTVKKNLPKAGSEYWFLGRVQQTSCLAPTGSRRVLNKRLSHVCLIYTAYEYTYFPQVIRFLYEFSSISFDTWKFSVLFVVTSATS